MVNTQYISLFWLLWLWRTIYLLQMTFLDNFVHVQHTYANIHLTLIYFWQTNGKSKYLSGSFNKPHFGADDIYQTAHNYILESKLQFTISLYLLRRYKTLRIAKFQETSDYLEIFFEEKSPRESLRIIIRPELYSAFFYVEN